jgi:hypothetical protein
MLKYGGGREVLEEPQTDIICPIIQIETQILKTGQ